MCHAGSSLWQLEKYSTQIQQIKTRYKLKCTQVYTQKKQILYLLYCKQNLELFDRSYNFAVFCVKRCRQNKVGTQVSTKNQIKCRTTQNRLCCVLFFLAVPIYVVCKDDVRHCYCVKIRIRITKLFNLSQNSHIYLQLQIENIGFSLCALLSKHFRRQSFFIYNTHKRNQQRMTNINFRNNISSASTINTVIKEFILVKQNQFFISSIRNEMHEEEYKKM